MSRLAVLGMVWLAACEPPAVDHAVPAEPSVHDSVLLTDAAGRPIELEAPARRIVSLVPSVTHVLVALGAADRLVGRTDYDTISEVRELPSVGGGLGPDLESLLLLDPDLVIRFAGDSDSATPARLDELGIAHLAVRPDRLADLDTIIGWMGAVSGQGPQARQLQDQIHRALDRVRSAVADAPRVRVAYLMGGTPPWTAGPGTYIDELIEVAGGVNAFADLGRLYGPVSPEAVATREIDVLLVAGGVQLDPRMQGDRRVHELQADLQMPGPQVIEALLEVARGLHPDLAFDGITDSEPGRLPVPTPSPEPIVEPEPIPGSEPGTGAPGSLP